MAKPSLTRLPDPAAKPVTSTPQPRPLQQRLRSKLDLAHLALERIDHMLEVAMEGLRSNSNQTGDDFGQAVITCLENTVTVELVPAKDRIVEALALLQEVANG